MATSPLEMSGPWTIDDLADIDDEWHRYEVVDGQLVVSPRATVSHQRLGMRLFRQLDRQAPEGWEADHEFALRVGTGDGRIPDLGLVRTVPERTPGRQIGYDPADVALVVEVVSPSSRKTDRLFKPLEYAAEGIGAYWRVETDPEVVVFVHELADGVYRVVQEVRGRGRVTVPFPMTLDVPALVSGLPPGP